MLWSLFTRPMRSRRSTDFPELSARTEAISGTESRRHATPFANLDEGSAMHKNDFQEGVLGKNYFRRKTGQIVSSVVAETKGLHAEFVRRRYSASARSLWHVRQPHLVLLWNRSGTKKYHMDIDGHSMDANVEEGSDLLLIPPDMEANVEFSVEGETHYSVTFLDRSLFGRLNPELGRPLVVSSNEAVRHGLVELSREAAAPDDVFDLFAEGWAMQAMAHLSRLAGGHHASREISRGGLAVANLRRVQDYIHSNLAATITLVELSRVAGLSRRHFLRAFRESTGDTPLGYVRALRIEEAKRRLSQGSQSITEVALDCGFSHAQHFATTFRTATGLAPSAFRRVCLPPDVLTRASRNEAIAFEKESEGQRVLSHR
jgi:AraC family transcriptional regulator